MDAQSKVCKPGTSPKSVENMLTLAVPLDQFVYLFILWNKYLELSNIAKG